MSIEDLLKPRYKVIADYPESNLEVGIIIVTRDCWQDFTIKFWCEANDKYPHLFRKLEWYEGRAIEDMPEYVKTDDQWVYKIKKWNIENDFVVGYIDTNSIIPQVITLNIYTDVKPATAEEYNTYKKQIKL